MEVVPGGHLAPTLTPTEVSEVFGIAESITCCMHFVSDRRKGNTAMCASVGSSLMIIIIQSICMALFMDHKDASESKHVNRYDDMWGGVVVENHVTHMLSPSVKRRALP